MYRVTPYFLSALVNSSTKQGQYFFFFFFYNIAFNYKKRTGFKDVFLLRCVDIKRVV